MTPKESPIVLNEEVMLAMKCSMPGGGAAASAHLSGLLWQPSRTLHSLASISARSQHPSELPPSAASSSFMSFKLIEDTSITMCFLFNFCFCSARCRPPKQILLWGTTLDTITLRGRPFFEKFNTEMVRGSTARLP